MSTTHGPTAALVAMVQHLSQDVQWTTTSALAEAADCHRDTARKILQQAAESGWVEHTTIDGTDRWRLGTALPQLGMAYLHQLYVRVAGYAQAFDQVVQPIETLHATMGLQSVNDAALAAAARGIEGAE